MKIFFFIVECKLSIYIVARIFFSMFVDYRLKIFTSFTQRYIVKGLHEAVGLSGVRFIGHIWRSPYGFKNYENSNKFVKKKNSRQDEWGIL